MSFNHAYTVGIYERKALWKKFQCLSNRKVITQAFPIHFLNGKHFSFFFFSVQLYLNSKYFLNGFYVPSW